MAAAAIAEFDEVSEFLSYGAGIPERPTFVQQPGCLGAVFGHAEISERFGPGIHALPGAALCLALEHPVQVRTHAVL